MCNDFPGLTDDNGHAQFAIDAASHFDVDGWAVNRFFLDREEAKVTADRLTQNFGCVRLYEWGRWQKQGGRGTLSGWVCFWWSDTDYLGFRPEGAGFGIPEGRVRPVTYEPAARN